MSLSPTLLLSTEQPLSNTTYSINVKSPKLPFITRTAKVELLRVQYLA